MTASRLFHETRKTLEELPVIQGQRSVRRRRLVGLLLAALGAGAIGLTIIHASYPLPYVLRVLAYRESNLDDIHRFPSRVIAASNAPSELPTAFGTRVADVIEEHAGIDAFDTFLAETETSAFLVVHRGRLVEERYLGGHDRASLQNTFSVSKSIASALVGLAIRDGLVALDTAVTSLVPELIQKDERFEDITLRHLLDMTSGIRYSRGVSFPFYTADDALVYYHPDLESVVLSRLAIASPPGTFQYNNYNPPLLGLMLRRATGMPVAEYLQRELWQPLGTEQAAGWTVDDRGFERMESGFHARARDLARFALLYLEKGRVDDRQILPESWIAESTDFSEPPEPDDYNGRSWWYGAGWWLLPRPDGPADFCAIGKYGQFIYLSPRYDVAFVRTGPGRGAWSDRDLTDLFWTTAARL